MCATAAVTGGAAAAAAAIQNARAMGVIVRLEPDGFLEIVSRQDAPLVVQSRQTVFFTTRFNYLTSYKGLAFFTSSGTPLEVPAHAEIVQAKSIWIPGQAF